MSTELIFEDPPAYPGAGPGSPLTGWLASLREHPGKWAKYPTPVHAGAGTAIARGQRYKVAPGEFEVKGSGKGAPANTSWIWVRFVGADA